MSDQFSPSGSAAWPSLESLPTSPPALGGAPAPPAAPFAYPPPLPGAGGGGSSPPPPSPPAKRRWYIASAVVAVLAILTAAAIIGYRAGQTTEVVAPATTTTAVPAPSTTATTVPTTTETTEAPTTTEAPSTSAPPAESGQAAVDAEVKKLETFVEQTRGLDFKQPVKVVALDDAAFVKRLQAVSDEDRDLDQERKTNDLLHALGLLPRGVDFGTAVDKASAGAVGGFYNPKDKELVVRGASIGPYERSVIAHELTHALDDQWFDLDRDFDGSKDEASFGFSSLVEGNARRVENDYVEQLSASDKRLYDQASAQTGSSADLAGVPRAILELLIAPYDFGEPLVRAQLAKGGQAALDKDFADPPTTSEQAMHPDKYLTREARKPVSQPSADGTVEDDGVIGEFGTYLMLSDTVGSRTASTAAAGWAGDWSVLYTQGRNVCARIDYVMDTPTDLQELKQAFTQWAAAGSGRTVTTPDTSRLRVTTCVPK